MPSPRWDIFCSVVDNFGDIGICWRLARQLAAEHGLNVRLWVDDLASFHRINPAIDPNSGVQHSHGVEVRHWTSPFVSPPDAVAEVVIDTFACTLPESYLAAMAAAAKAPRWVTVEHLSAEDWVAGCHGLASPQPSLPLTRQFFFPGFAPGTGGLLRERGLLEARRAFQADAAAQAAFWADLGLPPLQGDELRLSLFGYDCRHIVPLLRLWQASPRPLHCLVPEGALAGRIGAVYGRESAPAGTRCGAGALTVQVLPFVEQERYDRLLWACDLNFVRGEDSFVRAQWAGRPLVWQPYRQDEGAHDAKLEAFLHRYCAGQGAQEAAALRDLWLAWNREAGMAEHWDAFLAHRAAYAVHAELWTRQMSDLGDLAANLVFFCRKPL